MIKKILFLITIGGSGEIAVELFRYDKEFKKSNELSTSIILGETLYFQLTLVDKNETNLVVQPQNCYAEKSDGSNRHYLIKDR